MGLPRRGTLLFCLPATLGVGREGVRWRLLGSWSPGRRRQALGHALLAPRRPGLNPHQCCSDLVHKRRICAASSGHRVLQPPDLIGPPHRNTVTQGLFDLYPWKLMCQSGYYFFLHLKIVVWPEGKRQKSVISHSFGG